MRENVVMTTANARPSVQTSGKLEGRLFKGEERSLRYSARNCLDEGRPVERQSVHCALFFFLTMIMIIIVKTYVESIKIFAIFLGGFPAFS